MIDVFYLIRMDEYDEQMLHRFQCSFDSLMKNKGEFSVSVADVSEEPQLETIRKFIKHDFNYTHDFKTGGYNRSFNINVGYKAFVKSKFFVVLDIDIVTSPRFIKYCEKLIREGYKCATFNMYRLKEKIWDSDYNKLIKTNGGLGGSGGGMLCDSMLFKQLRGFNEEFEYWGAEDSEFYVRVKLSGVRFMRSNTELPFVHLWHPDNKHKIVSKYHKNKRLFEQLSNDYTSGRTNINDINPFDDFWGPKTINRIPQIQTSGICNAKCVMCPYQTSTSPKGIMSDKTFDKVIEVLSENKVMAPKIAMYMQGEPLLDPNIATRIKQIYDNLPGQFNLVEISTNCSLLDEIKTNSIIDAVDSNKFDIWLSFHGLGKEETNRIMGTNYDVSMANLKSFLSVTDSIANIRRRIMAAAFRDEDEIIEYWNKIFDDMMLSRKPSINIYVPSNRGGNVKLRSEWQSRRNHCSRLSKWLHITWDGKYIICCNDYNLSLIHI